RCLVGSEMCIRDSADPVDQAILLFRGESPKAAEEFARSDIYVREGLVKSWRVREWTTVIGPDASTPVGR
ncbi:MAG: hypothetical protein QUU85_16325, partial [Candidatus Eisenbacteria bacterium]|nr:hypothetical protein [Candidatus Eisenbacteria bacterium]